MSNPKKSFEYKLDQEITSLFKEPDMVGYASKPSKNITYSDFFDDKMLVIAAIRAGIPYSMFDVIQDNAPFTEDNWADFLDISTKSLQRYKTSEAFHFKAIHSEKILEMAEVTSIGLDVFGSMEKLKLWLNTPSYALGNLKPIELIKDSYGKELVIAELTRINYGILV
nr:antitoxin Xre/MbcA/ParS toxin-binding domain-containing protein [uncultured Pedobacter sp.]